MTTTILLLATLVNLSVHTQ